MKSLVVQNAGFLAANGTYLRCQFSTGTLTTETLGRCVQAFASLEEARVYQEPRCE